MAMMMMMKKDVEKVLPSSRFQIIFLFFLFFILSDRKRASFARERETEPRRGRDLDHRSNVCSENPT